MRGASITTFMNQQSVLGKPAEERARLTILDAQDNTASFTDAAAFIGVENYFLQQQYTSVENLPDGCLGVSKDKELLAVYGRRLEDGTCEASGVRNLSRLYKGETANIEWGKCGKLWGFSRRLTQNDILLLTTDEVACVRLRYAFNMLLDVARAKKNSSLTDVSQRLVFAALPAANLSPLLFAPLVGKAKCIYAYTPEAAMDNMGVEMADMLRMHKVDCVCTYALPKNEDFISYLNSKRNFGIANHIVDVYNKSVNACKSWWCRAPYLAREIISRPSFWK